jgi:Domain of unknown function (DUF4365)
MAMGDERGALLDGQMIAMQLKCVSQVRWKTPASRKDDGHRSAVVRINASTANYWLNLPLPVFLCMHEASSSQIYFCNAKQQARRRFLRCSTAKSVPFEVSQSFRVKEKAGLALLTTLAAAEREHERFASSLSFLLAHEVGFHLRLKSLQAANQNGLVDDTEVAVFSSFVNACRTVSDQLFIDWEGPTMNDVAIHEGEMFGDMDFRVGALRWGYERLVPVYSRLVARGRERVTRDEHYYWLLKDPFLVRACYSEKQKAAIAERREAARLPGGLEERLVEAMQAERRRLQAQTQRRV